MGTGYGTTRAIVAPMSEPPTIVVTHASVGSGHRIAAESIAEQLRRLAPQARVEVIDVLAYGSLRVSGDVASSAFTGPTAPLYDAVWGSTALGRSSMALSGPALSLLYRRFTTRLVELRPSVVVATHALPANLAVRASRSSHAPRVDGEASATSAAGAAGDARAPGAAGNSGVLAGWRVVAAATDFGLHGFWPHRGLALFCVADDAERDELVRRGTTIAEIAVTGIPVRAQFEAAIDRDSARARLGLPGEGRVVLALAGATQPGPYARFKESLAVSLPALAGLPGATVAIITGRDDAFAAELRQRVAGFGATNVRVLGYVEDMAGAMAAADVAVCKSGGLVTAECVSRGLPMVLIGPAVGQERANAAALTSTGAAVFEREPQRLAATVRKTLSSDGRLRRMGDAALTLRRPEAARAIAQRVLGLTGASE